VPEKLDGLSRMRVPVLPAKLTDWALDPAISTVAPLATLIGDDPFCGTAPTVICTALRLLLVVSV
jgi:hypothetical protein